MRERERERERERVRVRERERERERGGEGGVRQIAPKSSPTGIQFAFCTL